MYGIKQTYVYDKLLLVSEDEEKNEQSFALLMVAAITSTHELMHTSSP
jgi:hypothetical protein